MKCPFPDCYLEEHEDGDHKLGRPPEPRGELRFIQHFMQHGALTPFCDLHGIPKMAKPREALGFWLDRHGFAWFLCYVCVQHFIGIEFIPTLPPQVVLSGFRERSAR